MNKKGGKKYLSGWWLLVLIIITGGVVISISRINVLTDVSELDAEVLANRVLNCIVKNGEIVIEIDKQPNIFSLCKIEFRQGKSYFIGIEIYETRTCELTDEIFKCGLKNKFYFGDKSMEDRCIKLKGINVAQMPVCSYKKAYAMKNEQEYAIEVIGGTSE